MIVSKCGKHHIQTIVAIRIMKYTIGEEFFGKFDWGSYMVFQPVHRFLSNKTMPNHFHTE
ncbi:MAG TPA: hypothetical protein ENI57_04110 [Ignavibacteria bacterium]|nr:hypothetical protein [Ignavibacteria bacterium]